MFSHRIILGSQSPRRRQLLSDAGIPFEIRTQDTEETWPAELPLDEVAAFLAEKKATALVPTLQAGEVLLTADSVVLIGDAIYNKPADHADACRMLRELSGHMHRVITGVCLQSLEKKQVFSEVSKVYFAEMTEAEIEHYVARYQPFDKAGSYAVQEWVGLCKIRRIEGDFYNIMGLPVQAVYARLMAW